MVNKLCDNLFGDIRFGSGWALIGTNIVRENNKEDYYNVSTIFFNFGTALKRVVFKKRLLKLSVNYFFVLYNLFKNRLGGNFGKQHLTMSCLHLLATQGGVLDVAHDLNHGLH